MSAPARPFALAILALALVAFGLWHLEAASDGLTVQSTTIGETPATVYRLAGAPPAPTIVIAHGFAGSRELMQPFAITLARNGYVAVTFDFLGHGKNPRPLRGSILAVDGATKALVDQLASIIAFARTAPGGDGHVALLGHSMASDIVVRAAQMVPGVDATIAVSMYSQVIKPGSPRDLLVIAGGLEPAMLKDEGRRVTAMASDGPPRERVTYGDFRDGTARRFSFSSGVEHIGVLYSRESLREALDWLDAVYGRHGSGFLDARGLSLGALFVGLVLLARPLATLLPVVAAVEAGAGLAWSALIPIALLPAIMTPLILWKVPTGFLPILLGDYLAAHFFVYGLLTTLGLLLLQRDLRSGIRGALPHRVDGIARANEPARLAFAAGLMTLYSVIVFGLPIDRYLASFMPIPARVPLLFAMMIGTLPYFLADEWLVRGVGARRGAYAFTKLCFLVSLAIAVALNLEKLFFLIIIAFVILLFFVVYGLFSGWAYRATHHPFVGGLANAIAFAWAIAVTFPILA